MQGSGAARHRISTSPAARAVTGYPLPHHPLWAYFKAVPSPAAAGEHRDAQAATADDGSCGQLNTSPPIVHLLNLTVCSFLELINRLHKVKQQGLSQHWSPCVLSSIVNASVECLTLSPQSSERAHRKWYACSC